MMRKTLLIGMTAALLMLASEARAEDDDPTLVVAVGAVGEWALTENSASHGANVFLEFTPIEEWLEVELGANALYSKNDQKQWETGMLFKIPNTLAEGIEFAYGIGPQWNRKLGDGEKIDSFGLEAAIELSIWPWEQHRFGWYFEPSYGYDFGKGREQSFTFSMGLLIGIP